ncbi:MAG: hypothetical protein M3329_06135 [Pseudomonadota bacterium]|nr:hypothetical protein [Pseudomonadota bacterium]
MLAVNGMCLEQEIIKRLGEECFDFSTPPIMPGGRQPGDAWRRQRLVHPGILMWRMLRDCH